MVAKNRNDTQTEINSLLNTSGAGDISATDVRTTAETAKDSNLNLLETGNQDIASTVNDATIAGETTRSGTILYADTATASTPITVIGGAGFVAMPNDGLSPDSSDGGKVTGVGELWDAGTGLFTWTDGLVLNDICFIRLSFIPTTTAANQTVTAKLQAAIGGSPYPLFWSSTFYKTSGIQEPVVSTQFIFMGDTNTLNNGARFEVESDSNCDIEVVDWAIVHLLRN